MTRATLLLMGLFGGTVFLAACGTASTAGDAQSFVVSGDQYRQSGNWSACVSAYSRAISDQPQLVSAYSGRAQCYASQGNAPAAVADFSQAIKLSPNDPDLYLGRGFADEQVGNKSLAGADFVKAGNLTSGSPDSVVRAIGGLSEIGFYRDGLALADAAVKLFPDSASLHQKRADLRAALGNDQEALSEYNVALRLAKATEIPDIATDLGNFLLVRREFAMAIASFTRAIVVDPRYWPALDGRGKARMATGDLAGAEKDLTAAIGVYVALSSPNTWPLVRLYEGRGNAYLEDGRKSLAAADFQNALTTLTPSGPPDWRSQIESELRSAGSS